jgi:hypothetical protein
MKCDHRKPETRINVSRNGVKSEKKKTMRTKKCCTKQLRDERLSNLFCVTWTSADS